MRVEVLFALVGASGKQLGALRHHEDAGSGRAHLLPHRALWVRCHAHRASVFSCRGALLSLNPGTLGGALSPALMSNSTLATIQGR